MWRSCASNLQTTSSASCSRLLIVPNRSLFLTPRSSSDHYERLGVRKDATQNEIKQAFYAKSKQLHPDGSHDASDSERTAATKAFVELKEAYDVLRRPSDRRSYDFGERLKERRSSRPAGAQFYHANYQHYDYGSTFSSFHRDDSFSSRMSESEHKRKSDEQWRIIWKWTAVGAFVVVLYNVGYLLQIHYREQQIARLVDKDEIAKCFLRQQEYRDKLEDQAEINSLAQILKDDVDAAYRRRNEEHRERNTDEIREEYRWLKAVQDVDHTRRVKARRAALRKEGHDGKYFDSMVEKYEDPLPVPRVE